MSDTNESIFYKFQIIFIELKCRRKNALAKTKLVYQFGGHKIPPSFWNIYKMVACFGCGAVFSQLLTDVGKKFIGRLRPNFIDVCRPNIPDLCVPGNHSYIENYSCSNPSVHDVNESRFVPLLSLCCLPTVIFYPTTSSSYSFQGFISVRAFQFFILRSRFSCGKCACPYSMASV